MFFLVLADAYPSVDSMGLIICRSVQSSASSSASDDSAACAAPVQVDTYVGITVATSFSWELLADFCLLVQKRQTLICSVASLSPYHFNLEVEVPLIGPMHVRLSQPFLMQEILRAVRQGCKAVETP